MSFDKEGVDCKNIVETKDLNCFEGNVEQFINHLSKVFEKTFFEKKVMLKGKVVEVSTKRESDNKLERFWHVISNTDYSSQEKTYPNMKRCNAVYYISNLLKKCKSCKNYRIFDRKEKNILKTYIWCLDHNIMIVLQNMEKRYRFITCFIVEGERNLSKYQKRYEECKNKNGHQGDRS